MNKPTHINVAIIDYIVHLLYYSIFIVAFIDFKAIFVPRGHDSRIAIGFGSIPFLPKNITYIQTGLVLE